MKILKKAGVVACFFLSTTLSASADDAANLPWKFSDNLQKAYQLVLNLQPDKAQEILNRISSPNEELYKMYVMSLSETIDVLITEDPKKFEQLEANFHQRYSQLEKLPESAEKLFLEAELNLQKGFDFINMEERVNAVLAFRRAYNYSEECIKKYPTFIPIKKTYGVIQVMLGAVPDKYHWLTGLLGMHGSISKGQKLLQELKESKSSLSVEATILYSCVEGFINQHFTEAANNLNEVLKEQPTNRLALFISINMCMKNSQSENALEYMNTLDKNNQGLQMYYIDYLHGEALLNKGEYQSAINYYQKFLKGYRNDTFKKDSYYKIAVCYWLLNNEQQSKIYFEKAKTIGREQADPDKNAAMQLAENKLANQKLLKVRFFTDGGYYKEAKQTIESIKIQELRSLKEQTEYFYRIARLAHKTNELTVAKIYYEETIKISKENPWYFAPNSALQLGYIYRDQKDFANAKKYFELAMSYRKHEYKSSIDTKSRSALDELKTAKV